MQTSDREQKAPLRPHEGGEPASLTPRGRSHAAGWKCSGGGRISSPFQPRHSRCPTRAAPLEARERAARTAREEDGGGAYRKPRREGRGRRQGLEAKAAREGLLGVGAKDSSSSRTLSSSLPPHSREGERRGTVLVTPGKSPDKGKPRPHSAGRALRPRFFPTRGMRAQPKGEPRRGAPASNTTSRLWLGPLGAPSAGRDVRARVGGLHYPRLHPTLPPTTVPVFFQCHLWR